MNSKKQGTLGVSKAISYFVERGNSVSIPLGDDQRYDLVVDIEGKLYRVEVKTSLYINTHGKYQVNLKTSSGSKNKDAKAWKLVYLDKKDCDLVFIYVGNETQYLFPIEILNGKGTLIITSKIEQYKI